MKIGWLVWEFSEDEHPKFCKDGEEPYYCYRRIRIVYAEVADE